MNQNAAHYRLAACIGAATSPFNRNGTNIHDHKVSKSCRRHLSRPSLSLHACTAALRTSLIRGGDHDRRVSRSIKSG